MRRGKEIVQACHAIEKLDTENLPKICMRVNSEKELLEFNQVLFEQGIDHCLIKDAGLTEFKKPEYTCLAYIYKTSIKDFELY